MTDVVLLRVLGIVANLLDMAYCYKGIPSPLWLNIRWGALYVVINVVQLFLLYSETRSVQLDPEAREVYATHFEPHGVTQPQFAKLMASTTRRAYAGGVELVREGELATTLLLLVDGSAAQHRGGLRVANADSTFVGNLAFLADSKPTYQSTWITTGPAHALEWNAEELKSMLKRNPDLGICFRGALRGALLDQHSSSLSQAHLNAYTHVLAGVAGDGTVTADERQFCSEFRKRHGVSDAQHADALKAMGWTPAAFEAGKL
eukprot:Transcript_3644.p2 GENE.Transcript_3644~~Transcript_3644.p2  ORF type:complete len:261 (-),score=92.40 Transcript_3644:153-935(-)